MPQDLAERSREPINHGSFINQFPHGYHKKCGNSKGYIQKYVDKRYLYCLMKYTLIYIYGTPWNSNAQLAYFSYLFQVAQIADWDVLRSSANSQIILRGLHSTKSLIASWLRSDGSISQWRIDRTRLWKPVSDLMVSNETLAINTTNFLCCFLFLLLFCFCYFLTPTTLYVKYALSLSLF